VVNELSDARAAKGLDAHYFDLPDLEQMRLVGRLPTWRRVQRMLDARELVVGLIRGRLQRRYPHLSPAALNLKVLEETTRAPRTHSRP
jgi:hypothetical protein